MAPRRRPASPLSAEASVVTSPVEAARSTPSASITIGTSTTVAALADSASGAPVPAVVPATNRTDSLRWWWCVMERQADGDSR